MTDKLTIFEKEILEDILKEERPEFLEHIANICVNNREYTGHGMYINFEDNIQSGNENITLGKKKYLDIDGLEYGSGTILYIDFGKISMLELFSHGGEVFPKKIKSYKIVN